MRAATDCAKGVTERRLVTQESCVKKQGFQQRFAPNRERLARLAALDPINRPPRGFWGWQQELRTLRLLLRWHAAQADQDDPWPDKRALRLHAPVARELPIELQTFEGRRKLIDGLSYLRTNSSRACQFILYTGLRRREGMTLRRTNLVRGSGIAFQSKTRRVQLPPCSQALALIQPDVHGRLLGVSEWQLRKPLLRIFGEMVTPQGRRACVTPHDLRRYFKTVGTELSIDPTVMNLLVGHSVQGVNKSYIANLRFDVLRAAAQRIGDEIENPRGSIGDRSSHRAVSPGLPG